MPHPNIICLVTDQQRADHLGCAGNPDVQTPHIDRLANEGVVFTESFVANVVCMPNRACMFTGRYPKAHGARENGIPLQPTDGVLPGVLRRAGYQTASFGKIHLAPFDDRPGHGLKPHERVESAEYWSEGGELPLPYHGLEHVYFVGGHVHYSFGHYKQELDRDHPGTHALLAQDNALEPPTGAWQSWKLSIPAELHYTNAIADKTIEYLKARDTERPFFIWCSFPDPHFPFAAPEPYCRMYDPHEITFSPIRHTRELDSPAPYLRTHLHTLLAGGPSRVTTDDHLREMMAHTYGMISFVDDAIGRVVGALEELALLDNTIIVFLSDHADLMGDHWLLAKGPFLYGSLTRVPTIWRLPGTMSAGTASEALVSTVDLMPTLLDLVDVAIPGGVQGRSYKGLLKGTCGAIRDRVYIEFDESEIGDRLRHLRSKDWAVTYYVESGQGMLFDLCRDPGELNNLWDDPGSQDTRRELLAELLRATVQADDWLPPKECHA